MTLGGADGGDGLLIGPILDWWEKRSTKRDAKRTAKAEARNRRRESHAKTSAPTKDAAD